MFVNMLVFFNAKFLLDLFGAFVLELLKWLQDYFILSVFNCFHSKKIVANIKVIAFGYQRLVLVVKISHCYPEGRGI